ALGSYQRSAGMNGVGESDDSESDQQWLGRAAGWYLVTALGWLGVTFLIFAGPLVHKLSFLLRPDHWKEVGAALAAISGPLSWIIAKTRPLFEGVGKGAGRAKPLAANTFLSISVTIFLALVTIFLSGGLDSLLLGDPLVLLLRLPGMEIVHPGWLLSSATLLF